MYLQEIQPFTVFEYNLVLVDSNTKDALQWKDGENLKYTVPKDTNDIIVMLQWTHEWRKSDVPSIAIM